MYQASVRNSLSWDANSSMRSDWNFDTIKSSSAMGTFRSMAKDLAMPPGMEEEDEEESEFEECTTSIETGATKGSEPIVAGGLGMNHQAAHSTVIIRPSRPQTSDSDISNSSEELAIASNEASDPAAPLGAPPAYSGSIRSSRRASYAARNTVSGAGTVLREADLGTGVDTIRPVKKVDPVGSLRLSAEYVGSLRKDGSGSAPTSPTTRRRASSEAAKAGKAIVEDVVLPIIQNVRFYF